MPTEARKGEALAHESATAHVSGSACYIDDIPEIGGTLHAAVGYSEHAHADLTQVDLSAVAASTGVYCTLTAADLMHGNDIGPVLPGDPLLADTVVEYAGQAIFAVAGESRQQARRACRQAKISYAPKPAILSIKQALAQQHYLIPADSLHRIQRGDVADALSTAAHRCQGEMFIGGQEHFYLEGQVAYAIAQENNGMLIYSSTQHPSEIQILAAKILGVPQHAVTVRVRRMGGAFGGKETQAAQTAILAAVLAQKSQRPVKLRLSRKDDFCMTGKRHPFLVSYDVGFNADGRIQGADIRLAADCGMSADLSLAIVDRAMFHADNCYHYPAVSIVGIPCKTHTASNTAFRGFGGPQGMLLAERIMQDIANTLNCDGLAVRQQNLYNDSNRNATPYGQTIEDKTIEDIVTQLAASADYQQRQQDILTFNQRNRVLKKGLALTPVKFGISFTTTFLNQAGALLNVYTDGTVLINHGGTEMGQGLFTKVQQVVATEFGIAMAAVRGCATDTDKVPNTSPTAASSGADMNCMAAAMAAITIKHRLATYLAERHQCNLAQVHFADNQIFIGDNAVMTFGELVRAAYLQRISLSATGYYRTPKIDYDKANGCGRPFYYYSYGAAASEVMIDTLTGEHRLLRVDILHDVANSLNPAIDCGQIEGGYTQGLGWLTSEELHWNEAGQLTVTGPATYKIPAVSDVPADFRLALYTVANREETIYRSKAVGEPPLMLALSAWAALENAATAAAGKAVTLPPPATPECVLNAIRGV